MRVEIWSDIACPWCYIGKARFEQGLAGFEHRDAVEVVHRSFELDPHREHGKVEPVIPLIAAKYGATVTQVARSEERIAEHARAEGLDYRAGGRDHGSTFDMHRLLHLAKEHGAQSRLLELLYRANFADEQSAFGDERLLELAVQAGLEREEAQRVLADRTAYADAVREDEAAAGALGATGVPFFVVDGAVGVSGAQPPEVFRAALDEAWGKKARLTVVGPGGDAGDGSCGPDGCLIV
ncbi:DsbA family oxidoreductase [Kitasatospora sp. NPDC048540]|uniref:DsbA family oxidoreductase n=1 Tax=Kitasatospora sp. NPDC048540 TaxID=3155634 RepID=UPI0033F79774